MLWSSSPDHGEVLARARESADPQVLRAVRVLVLVDVQVAPAIVVVGEHARRLLEQPHGLVQQVVEVERALLAQPRLVALVGAGRDLLVVTARHLRGLCGREQVVLPAADLAQDCLRLELARADQLEVAHDQLHRRRLVVGVVDGEARVDADGRSVAPQHARAQRMEGAHGHFARALPDERQDACAHLCRGLVGERHGQDLPRLDVPDTDQVGDAVREDARLARAGAGEDQQRALRRGHCARLLWVEAADHLRGERLAIGAARVLLIGRRLRLRPAALASGEKKSTAWGASSSASGPAAARSARPELGGRAPPRQARGPRPDAPPAAAAGRVRSVDRAPASLRPMLPAAALQPGRGPSPVTLN